MGTYQPERWGEGTPAWISGNLKSLYLQIEPLTHPGASSPPLSVKNLHLDNLNYYKEYHQPKFNKLSLTSLLCVLIMCHLWTSHIVKQIDQCENVGLSLLVDTWKSSRTKIQHLWEVVIKAALLGSSPESLILYEIIYAIRCRFPSCPDFSMANHHSPLLHTFIVAGTLKHQNFRDYINTDTFLMFQSSLRNALTYGNFFLHCFNTAPGQVCHTDLRMILPLLISFLAPWSLGLRYQFG